jgi:hypothetical protein
VSDAKTDVVGPIDVRFDSEERAIEGLGGSQITNGISERLHS